MMFSEDKGQSFLTHFSPKAQFVEKPQQGGRTSSDVEISYLTRTSVECVKNHFRAYREYLPPTYGEHDLIKVAQILGLSVDEFCSNIASDEKKRTSKMNFTDEFKSVCVKRTIAGFHVLNQTGITIFDGFKGLMKIETEFVIRKESFFDLLKGLSIPHESNFHNTPQAEAVSLITLAQRRDELIQGRTRKGLRQGASLLSFVSLDYEFATRMLKWEADGVDDDLKENEKKLILTTHNMKPVMDRLRMLELFEKIEADEHYVCGDSELVTLGKIISMKEGSEFYAKKRNILEDYPQNAEAMARINLINRKPTETAWRQRMRASNENKYNVPKLGDTQNEREIAIPEREVTAGRGFFESQTAGRGGRAGRGYGVSLEGNPVTTRRATQVSYGANTVHSPPVITQSVAPPLVVQSVAVGGKTGTVPAPQATIIQGKSPSLKQAPVDQGLLNKAKLEREKLEKEALEKEKLERDKAAIAEKNDRERIKRMAAVEAKITEKEARDAEIEADKDKKRKASNGRPCPVCLDDPWGVMNWSVCGHKMHDHCYEKLMDDDPEDAKCPSCRTKLEEVESERIDRDKEKILMEMLYLGVVSQDVDEFAKEPNMDEIHLFAEYHTVPNKFAMKLAGEKFPEVRKSWEDENPGELWYADEADDDDDI
jgi:hypothetical protein